MPFTAIDIVFLLIIFISAVHAAIKGFLNEVFGLGSFIVGAYFAYFFMPKLAPYLAKSMSPALANIISFLLLFIVIFLVMKIIQHALKSIFSGTILTSLDHGLGFIFGIAEGFFLVVLVFVLLQALQTWIDTEAIRQGSFFYKTFGGFIKGAASGAKFLESI